MATKSYVINQNDDGSYNLPFSSSRDNLKLFDLEQRMYVDTFKTKFGKTTIPQAYNAISHNLSSVSSILNGTYQVFGKKVARTWHDRDVQLERELRSLDSRLSIAVADNKLTDADAHAILETVKTKIDIRYKNDKYVRSKGLQENSNTNLSKTYSFLDLALKDYEATPRAKPKSKKTKSAAPIPVHESIQVPHVPLEPVPAPYIENPQPPVLPSQPPLLPGLVVQPQTPPSTAYTASSIHPDKSLFLTNPTSKYSEGQFEFDFMKPEKVEPKKNYFWLGSGLFTAGLIGALAFGVAATKTLDYLSYRNAKSAADQSVIALAQTQENMAHRKAAFNTGLGKGIYNGFTAALRQNQSTQSQNCMDCHIPAVAQTSTFTPVIPAKEIPQYLKAPDANTPKFNPGFFTIPTNQSVSDLLKQYSTLSKPTSPVTATTINPNQEAVEEVGAFELDESVVKPLEVIAREYDGFTHREIFSVPNQNRNFFQKILGLSKVKYESRATDASVFEAPRKISTVAQAVRVYDALVGVASQRIVQANVAPGEMGDNLDQTWTRYSFDRNKLEGFEVKTLAQIIADAKQIPVEEVELKLNEVYGSSDAVFRLKEGYANGEEQFHNMTILAGKENVVGARTSKLRSR